MFSSDGLEWFVELAYGGSRLAIELLLQSTVLIALGLLAGWLVRSKGAAVQSAIYRVTMVAVLACPVVSLLLRARSCCRIVPAAHPLRRRGLLSHIWSYRT